MTRVKKLSLLQNKNGTFLSYGGLPAGTSHIIYLVNLNSKCFKLNRICSIRKKHLEINNLFVQHIPACDGVLIANATFEF
jgi:hypothetical protein